MYWMFILIPIDLKKFILNVHVLVAERGQNARVLIFYTFYYTCACFSDLFKYFYWTTLLVMDAKDTTIINHL